MTYICSHSTTLVANSYNGLWQGEPCICTDNDDPCTEIQTTKVCISLQIILQDHNCWAKKNNVWFRLPDQPEIFTPYPKHFLQILNLEEKSGTK